MVESLIPILIGSLVSKITASYLDDSKIKYIVEHLESILRGNQVCTATHTTMDDLK